MPLNPLEIQQSPKDKLSSTWNGGLPLLNRLLWANIESLPKKSLERLLTRYTAREYLRFADADKLKRVEELNAKRRRPIDLEGRLRELADGTVHNAFHFEVLCFARKQGMLGLAAHCEDRLTKINEMILANVVT
jgi:hypothetical protein